MITYTDFLAIMADSLRNDRDKFVYLELGIDRGHTFNAVALFSTTCVGVGFGASHWEAIGAYTQHVDRRIVDSSTEEFFAQGLAGDLEFDMVFVDADHERDQVLRDVENSLLHLAEGGYIFLHDTYPRDEAHIDPAKCGNSYEAAFELSRNRDDLETITFAVPHWHGLTLIRKRSRQLTWRNTDGD